jgi:hypothetical protein
MENDLRKLVQKIKRDPTVELQRYGYFDPFLNSGWQDLLITVLRLLNNPKENSLRKLVQIFERGPTWGSKVMAILTRYSNLANQTSSSSSSDYIETLRKTTSKNSCKMLNAIQRSNKKGMAILTRY